VDINQKRIENKENLLLMRSEISFSFLIIFFRCAAEILDDFIPISRQYGDFWIGARETKNLREK